MVRQSCCVLPCFRDPDDDGAHLKGFRSNKRVKKDFSVPSCDGGCGFAGSAGLIGRPVCGSRANLVQPAMAGTMRFDKNKNKKGTKRNRRGFEIGAIIIR